MSVESEENEELGYETFDSADFAADDAIPDQEDLDSDPGKEKSAEAVEGAADDLKADKPEDGTEVVDSIYSDSKDHADEAIEVKPVDGEGDKSVDTPAYEPNLTYKVYDEVKEFPEEMKGMVTTKEGEDYVRTLLSKADALEPMKEKQVGLVQERDNVQASFQTQTDNINRAMSLRDKQPDLFCAEFAIGDDWILKMANRIADAKATPEQWQNFEQNRNTAFNLHQQQVQFDTQQSQQQVNSNNSHKAAMSEAIMAPEAFEFAQKFDSVNGAGSFKEEVRMYGSSYFQTNKQNIPPVEAVKAVLGKYNNLMPAAAPVQQVAGATQQKPRTRPQSIPNTGRGRNVSPTRTKPKDIEGLKRLAAAMED